MLLKNHKNKKEKREKTGDYVETKEQDTKKPKSQHEIKEDAKKNTLRQMTMKTQS